MTDDGTGKSKFTNSFALYVIKQMRDANNMHFENIRWSVIHVLFFMLVIILYTILIILKVN